MQQGQKITLVVIQGPTGVGKTAVALELAELFPIEIINADSMQVYRCMDIGTSKPDAAQQARIPHHLFSVADPDEDFSAADYLLRGRAAIGDIAARGCVPLIVGGTGLYVQALLHGLSEAPGGNLHRRSQLRQQDPAELYAHLQGIDPQSAARIHPHDTLRIVRALEVFITTGIPLSAHHAAHQSRPGPYNCLRICLGCERAELYRRIDQRVEQMFSDGFVQEVRGLLERGFAATLKPMQAIGYRHVIEHLNGTCSLDEALQRMKQDTRHLAKRQITWLKRVPEAHWFRLPREHELIAPCIKKALNIG
jgi:tRNA dimethylallyltransferase